MPATTATRVGTSLRAIIFDMDGTLYRNAALGRRYQDSIIAFLGQAKGWTHAHAARAFAERYHRLHVQLGREPSKLYTLAQFGVSDQAWARHQGGHVVPDSPLAPNPRLRRALLRLREGFRLGLVTNNHRGNTRVTLERLGVADLFDEIMTLTETRIFKPSPQLYWAMAARLGVPPEDCLSVGDRYDLDLEPAARVGMQTLWVRRLNDVYRLPGVLAPGRADRMRMHSPGERRRVARRAAALLRSGGLAVLPTDTVYGLAALPVPESVRWLYRAKGRAENQPVVLLLDDARRADRCARLTPRMRQVMAAQWPGPLTLVLPVKPGTAWGRITRGGRQVGLRVPDHPWLRSLIRSCGGILATTSANRSGDPAPHAAGDVPDQVLHFSGLLADAGRTGLGVNSTVVQWSKNQWKILRSGSLAWPPGPDPRGRDPRKHSRSAT